MNTQYKFMKTYLLEAQTPLIHFQHAQSGATLRATEVKPKLDSFLHKKAEKEGIDLEGKKKEGWFVGDTKSLNYKLRFTACGEQEYVDLGFKTDYDIFYGNMGNSTLYKKGIKGNVQMNVICLIPNLLQFIDKHICEFFVVTNFGTMQNKGFGSYVIDGKAYSPWFISKCLKDAYGAETCYTFKGGYKPFKAIKTVYSIIKSGVNFRAYQRSLLFLYMHKEHAINNEKAWLKQKGFAPSDVGYYANKGDKNQQNQPSYYVRALLGISDHIDFINDINNKRDKTEITIAHNGKTIERFNSPIFFKVIDRNVYFIAKKIEKDIFGSTFEFASPKGKGILTVPTEEQLGKDFMERFLSYCKDELNNGALQKFDDTKYTMIEEV